MRKKLLIIELFFQIKQDYDQKLKNRERMFFLCENAKATRLKFQELSDFF